MAFRPDVDFAPLLSAGVMSHEALRAIFGKPPTADDMRHCVEQFRTKHPEHAATIRTSGGRLYLMGAREAKRYRVSRIGAAITSVQTQVRLHDAVPVAQLTEEERRQHRVECDSLAQIKLLTNPLRKPLPGQNQR